MKITLKSYKFAINSKEIHQFFIERIKLGQQITEQGTIYPEGCYDVTITQNCAYMTRSVQLIFDCLAVRDGDMIRGYYVIDSPALPGAITIKPVDRAVYWLIADTSRTQADAAAIYKVHQPVISARLREYVARGWFTSNPTRAPSGIVDAVQAVLTEGISQADAAARYQVSTTQLSTACRAAIAAWPKGGFMTDIDRAVAACLTCETIDHAAVRYYVHPARLVYIMHLVRAAIDRGI